MSADEALRKIRSELKQKQYSDHNARFVAQKVVELIELVMIPQSLAEEQMAEARLEAGVETLQDGERIDAGKDIPGIRPLAPALQIKK